MVVQPALAVDFFASWDVVSWGMSVPAWAILLAAFLLPLLEASAFVGVVFPGETAVILGGILAHYGRVDLGQVILCAIAGALIGDQIGYLVGKRYGRVFLKFVPQKVTDSGAVTEILALIERRGAMAIVIGRWTAIMRAFVPGLAGMSGLSQRRFTLANAAGGIIWAVVCAGGGFMAGAAYEKLTVAIGRFGTTITVLLVIGLAIWWHRRNKSQELLSRTLGLDSDSSDSSDSEDLGLNESTASTTEDPPRQARPLADGPSN